MLPRKGTEAVPEVGVVGEEPDGVSHSLFHRSIALSEYLP